VLLDLGTQKYHFLAAGVERGAEIRESTGVGMVAAYLVGS
jgi:hypothetical protein